MVRVYRKKREGPWFHEFRRDTMEIMAKQTKYKTEHIMVRTTPNLKRQIERAAAAEERTVASWVRHTLLAALRRDSGAVAPVEEKTDGLPSR